MAQILSGILGGNVPVTPMKSNFNSRPDSKMQDSPFSDYFTDDGRETSNETHSYYSPSPETQQLLVRLSKLQAQLMRGDDNNPEYHVVNVVSRKLDEIDVHLDTLHSQTRMPPELEDSGLFIEDDSEEQESRVETPSGNYGLQLRLTESVPIELALGEHRRPEDDRLLQDAQQVFENVTKLEEKLVQQRAYMEDLQDKYNHQSEDYEQQLASLGDENAALKSDLGFDQTELLFLKLHHRALEVEVEAIHEGARRMLTYAPEIREDIHSMERKRVKQEMRRWDAQWDAVNKRFTTRREKYSLPESGASADDEPEAQTGTESEESGDWQFETVKQDDGKVQSITIKRTQSQRGMFDQDALVEDEAEAPPLSETEPNAEAHVSDQEIQTSSEQEKPVYMDSSTQTDSFDLPPTLFDDDEKEVEDALEEYDCAITTATESNNDDSELSSNESDETVQQKVTRPGFKAAWQDLWQNLSDFAGMSEERF